MIDWVNLAANSLWILGCAMALAALSYASWQASLYKVKLRARLETPGIQRSLYLSGVLFSAGLAILSETIFETALWVILGALFIWALIMSFRRNKAPSAEKSNQG